MTRELTKKYLTDNFITVNMTPEGDFHVFQKDLKSDDIRERKIYPATTKHKCGTELTYLLVNIYDFDKRKWTNISLQRLVYVSFVGDIPASYDVDHKNDNTFDNLPSNLQLLTRQQNLAKRASRAILGNYTTTPIYCIETNQKFINISAASKALDTTDYYIRLALAGKPNKKIKYHFRYVEENKA